MVVAAVPSPSDGLSAMYQASASESGKSGRFTRASTYGAGKVRCMSIPFLGWVAGRGRVYAAAISGTGPMTEHLKAITPVLRGPGQTGTRTNAHVLPNRTPLADDPSPG